MLFLLVILGFVGLYIGAQLARRKRMLRYANTELLESFAPQRPKHWRHRIRRVLRSTPAIACSRKLGARSSSEIYGGHDRDERDRCGRHDHVYWRY